jgi:GH24 family phage-related lysozyme (muramidase)
MADQIDHQFISDREGGSRTTGYVPASGTSNSGVTVATGFDLGARNVNDLNGLALDTALVTKLKPYLGKAKKDAEDALKAAPLTISADEAEAIDKAVRQKAVLALKSKYLAAAGNTQKTDFFDLAAEAQTAIASVSFQYGDLATKTPKFWAAVTAQDWKTTASVLRAFGDAYKTRRGLEADLIDKLVPKDDPGKAAVPASPAPPIGSK